VAEEKREEKRRTLALQREKKWLIGGRMIPEGWGVSILLPKGQGEEQKRADVGKIESRETEQKKGLMCQERRDKIVVNTNNSMCSKEREGLETEVRLGVRRLNGEKIVLVGRQTGSYSPETAKGGEQVSRLGGGNKRGEGESKLSGMKEETGFGEKREKKGREGNAG